MTNEIMQGDSLSLLLFILYIDQYSKYMNKLPQKIPTGITVDNDKHLINHLGYIDDIKIFAKNKQDLTILLNATKEILKK